MLRSLEVYKSRSYNIVRLEEDASDIYWPHSGQAQRAFDHIERSLHEPTAQLESTADPLYDMANELMHQLQDIIPNPLPVLGLSYPFYLDAFQTIALKSAVKAAGFLAYVEQYETTTPQATTAGHGVGLCECPALKHSCLQQEARSGRMILSVDFSDHALEIRLYDRVQPAEWKAGGISVLQAFSYHESGRERKFWDSVTSAVKVLLAEAIEYRIDHVVLSGENADAPELHQAIYHGLEGMQPLFLTSGGRLHTISIHLDQLVDPEFAAALGIAELSWRDTMKDRACDDNCGRWKIIPGCPGLP